jgi:hypothetical protein
MRRHKILVIFKFHFIDLDLCQKKYIYYLKNKKIKINYK